MSNSRDESPPRIFLENTWLQGTIVSVFLYGIIFVLSVMCWRSLWPHIQSHNTGYKKCRFFFCCVTILFVLATIQAFFLVDVTQSVFISHRSYPGGPSAYAETVFSIPLGVTFLISDWCADILMIWRCIVVYRDTKMRLTIIILAAVMFVASFVIGILWLVIKSKVKSHWLSMDFFFPYICLALTITIFISLLTVLRLLYHRSRISKALGTGHGTIYASFAAMIIESAAVYSVCSLLFLIPFAIKNPLANAFGQILGEAQIVASLLIIFRVVEGWTTNRSSATITSSDQLKNLHHQLPSASATPDHVSIEITFAPVTTSDDSITCPKSRCSKEYAEVYDKTASAPVGTAV